MLQKKYIVKESKIYLCEDEWLICSQYDEPLTISPIHWLDVLQFIKKHEGDFKVVHNEVVLEFSKLDVLSFPGIPSSIELPFCLDCGSNTHLCRGKFGAFIGCLNYPQCKFQEPVKKYLIFSESDNLCLEQVCKNEELAKAYDLLGISWQSFEEARDFVRNLGLKSIGEWNKFCKGKMGGKVSLPKDIPPNPQHVYINQGWVSWGDWLGTQEVTSMFKGFRPFEEARQFARSLRLKNKTSWENFCKGDLLKMRKRPRDIPFYPDKAYNKDGWVSWGDWLGTDKF